MATRSFHETLCAYPSRHLVSALLALLSYLGRHLTGSGGRKARWCLASLALCLSLSVSSWDFDRLISRAQHLYALDQAATQRIRDWQQLLLDQQRQELQGQLLQVNLFFNNQLRFADDLEIWQEVDYWATPIEALGKGAADCEDYAIAKYVSLKKLGVAPEQLRLTYVKALELNQAHMVLAWYPTPDSEPLILDNLTDEILPASQRSDLVPVYSFNTTGLWLAGAQNNAQTGSARQLSRWQDLLKKMHNEGFEEPGSPLP
ncbi:MAG: transglutaminase-like cysteine peptidase [Pseudomonas sp.]